MCADPIYRVESDPDTAPVLALRLREMDWRRDHETVLSFQRETYEANFPGFRTSTRFLDDFAEQLRRSLRSRWERAVVLVDRQERVFGFLWLSLMTTMVEEWVGYIKNIYVAPQLRGQGYARVLLDEADRWFKAQNVAKASLDASTCNPRAISIYLEAGYEIARYRMEKRY
jgi:ribosomal protein S18 acetylase RimI-like enzyme